MCPPSADDIRMQLEKAQLASTPVFTLLIQVSRLSRQLLALFSWRRLEVCHGFTLEVWLSEVPDP